MIEQASQKLTDVADSLEGMYQDICELQLLVLSLAERAGELRPVGAPRRSN